MIPSLLPNFIERQLSSCVNLSRHRQLVELGICDILNQSEAIQKAKLNT